MSESAEHFIEVTRKGLADETGCNIETIRYYEKIGVLPPPKRTASGYRVYGSDDIKRLSFIRRLRQLGFTLAEIRQFLELIDGHDYTCREVHARTLIHISDVKIKVRDLRKIQATLSAMAEQCGRGEVPDCPIIDELFGQSGPATTAH